MGKIKPYIIHDQLTVQEIQDLIYQAYNEGYQDGEEEGNKAATYQEGYDEGFKHGKKEGYGEGLVEGVKITTTSGEIVDIPNYPFQPKTVPNTTPLTPNDWPPTVIYCGSNVNSNSSEDNNSGGSM